MENTVLYKVKFENATLKVKLKVNQIVFVVDVVDVVVVVVVVVAVVAFVVVVVPEVAVFCCCRCTAPGPQCKNGAFFNF